MLAHGWMPSSAARKLACVGAVVGVLLGLAKIAYAYEAAPGWVASDYVTGFSFESGAAGPGGLAFDASGNLFVGATGSATLHKVPPGGGTAAGTQLRNGYGSVTGLTFDKSGRLYMARGFKQDIVELNPSNGAIVRTVVSGLPCPVGLATDPISGDLFVSNVFCPGGGIFRITNVQNGPGVLRRYAGNQDADGITFAPDGTLYAAGGNTVMRIAGTNTSNPGSIDVVASVPTVDGLAYAPATATSPAFLMAARNDGQIDRVGLDGSVTPVVTGTSRGDLVTVGPDGCAYADLQDRVIKVGPAIGNCAFAPPLAPTTQPGTGGGGTGGGAPGQAVMHRMVDTAVKAMAPKRVRHGRRFTLRIKMSNRSQTMAHRPVLIDTLPRGATVVRARLARGVACKRIGKRTVRCGRTSLAGGRSFEVKIVVKAMRGSRYTNRVEVRSQDLDPTPGNNKSRSRTKVVRNSR